MSVVYAVSSLPISEEKEGDGESVQLKVCAVTYWEDRQGSEELWTMKYCSLQ